MSQNKINEATLGDLLLSLRRKIIESIKKEGMEHDLTFSQMEILQFIGISGKKTMKSIADYLKITPPSATAIVKDMEKKGLVSRINDKDDRRIVFIVIAEKTKKVFVSICKRKEMILKKMISKLDEKDKETLGRIIKIIITE